MVSRGGAAGAAGVAAGALACAGAEGGAAAIGAAGFGGAGRMLISVTARARLLPSASSNSSANDMSSPAETGTNSLTCSIPRTGRSQRPGATAIPDENVTPPPSPVTATRRRSAASPGTSTLMANGALSPARVSR